MNGDASLAHGTLRIEERVLEMQVEYVLESGEGVQADEASLTKPGGT